MSMHMHPQSNIQGCCRTVVVLVFLFTGCQSRNGSTPQYSSAYDAAEKTAPRISTSASSITPTLGASALFLPTTVVTPEPIPTLTRAQRSDLLPRLLLDKSACELPCWWKLTPGESSHQDARAWFEAHGIPLSGKQFNSIILDVGGNSQENYEYSVSIHLSISGTTITQMAVTGATNRGKLSNSFVEDFRRFGWRELIARLGKPSAISFDVMLPSEANAPSEYRLALEFANVGVVATYIGSAEKSERVGNTLKVCPVSSEVNTIELLMYASTNPPQRDEYERDMHPIDVDFFLTQFVQPDGKGCVDWSATGK